MSRRQQAIEAEWTVLYLGDEAGNAAGSRDVPSRIAQEAKGALGDTPSPARPANPKPESEETR